MLRGLQLAETQHISGSTFSATGFVTVLPDDVRCRLLEHGSPCCFAKGELIQQRGDTGREFWHIKSGTVQIGRYSMDGKLTLYALLGPGESFGEQAFLGDFPRLVDAIAASDTKLLRIGEAEFQAAIESDPRVPRILLKAMANLVRQAFDQIETDRHMSTVGRAAQAIARQCGEHKGEVAISVTQQELADLAGLSRISLGKALAKLEADGLISKRYGKITVHDSEALYGSFTR